MNIKFSILCLIVFLFPFSLQINTNVGTFSNVSDIISPKIGNNYVVISTHNESSDWSSYGWSGIGSLNDPLLISNLTGIDRLAVDRIESVVLTNVSLPENFLLSFKHITKIVVNNTIVTSLSFSYSEDVILENNTFNRLFLSAKWIGDILMANNTFKEYSQLYIQKMDKIELLNNHIDQQFALFGEYMHRINLIGNFFQSLELWIHSTSYIELVNNIVADNPNYNKLDVSESLSCRIENNTFFYTTFHIHIGNSIIMQNNTLATSGLFITHQTDVNIQNNFFSNYTKPIPLIRVYNIDNLNISWNSYNGISAQLIDSGQSNMDLYIYGILFIFLTTAIVLFWRKFKKI